MNNIKQLATISTILAGLCCAQAIQAKPQDAQSYQPKDGVVRLYGAGGPHTALIRAAKLYEKKTGTRVEVVFGPQHRWDADAKKKADIIWGTSEQSMTAFLDSYDQFKSDDVKPIYLRRAVIAVQKGNPKGISGIKDLLKPGMRIIVTEGGSGYNTSGTGVWEDVVGRLNALEEVKQFRQNIVAFAKGSGASFRAFKKQKADAWITWTHWPITHPEAADFVEIEPSRRIYRDLTLVTNQKADREAADFIAFLETGAAQEIFASEGWSR
jgi:accessory colonization factor AcfC